MTNRNIFPKKQGETPLLPKTVCAYVTLISALLLWKDVPIRHPSADTSPIPQLSAFPLQRGVPPLQPLAVRDPPPLRSLYRFKG